MATVSCELIFSIVTNLTSYRGKLPIFLQSSYSKDIFAIIVRLAPLIGIGEKNPQGGLLTVLNYLHGSVLAVSKQERLEEHNSHRRSNNNQHNSNNNKNNKNNNISYSQSLTDSVSNLPKQIPLECVEYPMMHFLIDIECAIIKLFVPIFSIVQFTLPSDLRSICNRSSSDSYAIGSNVHYFSPIYSNIIQGTIHQQRIKCLNNANQDTVVEFDIILKDGMKEGNVPIDYLLYSEGPSIEFSPYTPNFHGSRDHMSQANMNLSVILLLLFLLLFLFIFIFFNFNIDFFYLLV
jgi:hypothetical protein